MRRVTGHNLEGSDLLLHEQKQEQSQVTSGRTFDLPERISERYTVENGAEDEEDSRTSYRNDSVMYDVDLGMGTEEQPRVSHTYSPQKGDDNNI